MRPARSTLVNYLLALAAVAAATLARVALDPYLAGDVTYATFCVAVLAAAWWGGLGPALFAVAASVVTVAYFLLPPHGSWLLLSNSDIVGLGLFVLAALAIAALGQAFDRARRRAERHSESLRVTLTSIGDAVITTDRGGLVTFLNPIAETLTGWVAGEAIGHVLDEIFVVVNEETRAPVENPALRALRQNAVVELSNHTVLVARDGAEHNIDDSAAPIRDEDGAAVGSVLVFRDIGARRRAERDVRASELRFRTMADAIPQLAWMANQDGKIIWYNRRWYDYTGTTPAQMAAPRGWESVHDPGEWPAVIGRWRESIVTGEPFDMVVQLRAADGSFRFFLTRIAPVRDDDGRVVQWFGTKTDVSEVKRAEESLREADRRKDEFLATLAHELRNPLAPVRYALAVMQNAGGDGEAVDRARQMMERHVAQMVRLIDDLLDVSRISRGKLSLRMERVNLCSVMMDAVETVRPLVEANEHALAIELPDVPVPIIADATRLAQVFANLLNNSVKYTESGGEIRFAARADVSGAVVTVTDTGIGIPPAELQTIFEMFSQVDRSIERSQGGLGIGLTLVKRLVEMHGGTIEAHSEGHGRGSEFVVRLPLPPAQGAVLGADARAAREG